MLFRFHLPEHKMATTKTRTSAEKVIRIPLDQLHLMACYPIKEREDATFQETVNSIKEHGVLQPAIVRPREGGGYEIIAGRRRKIGCEQAQLPDMPCIVRKQNYGEGGLFPGTA